MPGPRNADAMNWTGKNLSGQLTEPQNPGCTRGWESRRAHVAHRLPLFLKSTTTASYRPGPPPGPPPAAGARSGCEAP